MLRVLRQSALLNYCAGLVVLCAVLLFLWPGLVQNLFASDGFMTHFHCYAQLGPLVALHYYSDLLIGLSYVAISFTLTYLVYRARRDIPFHRVFLAFGLFIIACGGTHFMEVWTTYHEPVYWLAGYVKLITAVASVSTAVVLWPLVPRTLALVRAAKLSDERRARLEKANAELSALYERVKELDELKTQFFANVSHELRTPLTLILGPAARLLAAPDLPTAARRDAETVERNTRALLKQVNDLLDIAKLEAGRMAVNYAQTDLARLVRLTGGYFESFALERGIKFEVDAPTALPAEADADKLQRVLLNLLANAFKFTPDGGTVRCALRPDATGRRVLIEVRDSGVGVAPELRASVFERYRQGETTPTRRHGGTGLGLAIVKEFVELHGGTVSLADAPEGGALFRVELPLHAPAGSTVQLLPAEPTPEAAHETLGILETEQRAAPPITATPDRASSTEDAPSADEAAPSSSATPSSATSSSATSSSAIPSSSSTPSAAAQETPVIRLALAPLVLVIEDNAEMSRFIAETLAPAYRVAQAYDGREGLRQAAALRPDLILCDVMLPGLGGEQLVADLRRQDALAHVPILMLTAKADEALRVRLLRAGAQDYLTKPFVGDELRLRVANLIAAKREREALEEDLTGLAREVSQRRSEVATTAAALRETNETLQAIIQASPLAIVVLDPTGVVKLWNSAAERIYGWREQEVLNRPLPSVPPEYEAEMRRNHAAGLAGQSFTNLETTRLRKDGTQMKVSISTAPLRNAAGQATGVVALVADITARKRAEAAQVFLADATTALAATLDYEQTLDILARLCVPALADFCLVDMRDDATGALRRMVVAHSDPARAAAWRAMQDRWPLDMAADYTIPQVIRTGRAAVYGEPNEAALRATLADEAQIQALLSFDLKGSIIVPLTARGRTFGALTFLSAESGRRYDEQDLALAEELARRAALAVDNARLYRRAQEANRAKDEFLATLSHELRTPLTPIIGWVHMLSAGSAQGDELRRGLDVIDKNAQALSRLINDLLDMSAILNGKMRIDRLPVTVRHVLHEAVETVRPEAARRRIEIELTADGDGGAGPLVAGDRTRLGQVFWNLISNAVKFSHEGGRVRVRCAASDGEVRVEVEDEGVGIAPEFLPHVFERFRQADMSTTKAHAGLGIGLALVKSFVEAHGGAVRASSAGPARGSRFTVTLPRLTLGAPVPPASGDVTAESAPDQSTAGAGAPRLLLVEDAADTLELLRVLFAGRGYRVAACASAAAALEVAARETFDIIVSDIGLPHIDGYALLARLRAEHPALSAAPAVALTGYATPQDAAAARAAGFADHVAKPVDPAVLLRAVERLLARRED